MITVISNVIYYRVRNFETLNRNGDTPQSTKYGDLYVLLHVVIYNLFDLQHESKKNL